MQLTTPQTCKPTKRAISH